MNETLPAAPPTEIAGHPSEGVPERHRRGRLAGWFRRRGSTPQPDAPAVETAPAPVAPEVRDTPQPVSQTSVARRTAVVLAILLAAVIAVAFRGSWTSQSDAARAAHFDPTGAFLYPFAPDGLIVLALVGAVVLRHKFGPRLYCLVVVVLFTITSYVINHLHGMGTFIMVGEGESAVLVKELDGRVVGLIAGQLVGSIAFGSHILMHVFRHLFPEALDGAVRAIATAASPPATVPDTPDRPVEGVPADPEAEREERKAWAAITVRMLLDNGIKPRRKQLADQYGISERQVSYVIADVERERETEAGEESPADPAGQLAERPMPRPLAAAGSVNGHVPGGES
ncbi:DUF2637 domain-containing protein [Nonomuraea rubra]|uniref:DUF2637 domain-containing protein n=1 Tax=Nonomuraea rubra TaxID=46180 RepID=UPI00340C47FF